MRTASESQASEAHRKRLKALREMAPEQRLLQALELSELVRDLFAEGLRRRFPDLSDDEFRALLLQRIDLCHNRNY